MEVRKIKDEIKNFKLAYNMQSTVDSETGLICAIPSIQSEDKIKPYKIKRLYNNYHACKKLINKEISAYQTNKHTQPSQKNCDRLIRAMQVKMEKEEYQRRI